MEPGQNCAYNHTRGCFIGMHVVGGEFQLASLLDWISTLLPESGAGIWMIPFRGLPSRELRTPVDLLYLDGNCRVIEAVELYPTFRVSGGCAPAASVLILPSHSISSSKTETGDQLLLCPNEEIKWRLEQLVETGSVGAAAMPAALRPPLRPVLVREQPAVAESLDGATGAAIEQAIERPVPQASIAPAIEDAGGAKTAMAETKAPAPAGELQERPVKPWMAPGRQPEPSALAKLGRWFLPEPRDPRKIGRRLVQGLVAHFFTGGAPQAHEIRDVSATGLYVITSERWYPGTIIRMTLSKPDTGQAPAERSITLQTRAVRWGNDGVGLEILLDGDPDSMQPQPATLGGVGRKQLERFLKGLQGRGR